MLKGMWTTGPRDRKLRFNTNWLLQQQLANTGKKVRKSILLKDRRLQSSEILNPINCPLIFRSAHVDQPQA